MSARVLMIGKRNTTMTTMAQKMENDGLRVRFSEDIAHVGRDFDGRDFDAVVVGRSVKKDDGRELKRILLAQNPNLSFVDSLGPYGELVGEQAKAALYAAGDGPKLLGDVAATGATVRFHVSEGCHVNVVVFQNDMMWQKLHRDVALDRTLPAGTHRVTAKRKLIRIATETIVIITVNGAEKAIVKL